MVGILDRFAQVNRSLSTQTETNSKHLSELGPTAYGILTRDAAVRVDIDERLLFDLLKSEVDDLVGNLELFEHNHHFPWVWSRS